MMHLVNTGTHPTGISRESDSANALAVAGRGARPAGWLRRLLELCAAGLRLAPAPRSRLVPARSFIRLDEIIAFEAPAARPRTRCPRRRRG